MVVILVYHHSDHQWVYPWWKCYEQMFAWSTYQLWPYYRFPHSHPIHHAQLLYNLSLLSSKHSTLLGVVFGFPGLVLILRRTGVFEEVCSCGSFCAGQQKKSCFLLGIQLSTKMWTAFTLITICSQGRLSFSMAWVSFGPLQWHICSRQRLSTFEWNPSWNAMAFVTTILLIILIIEVQVIAFLMQSLVRLQVFTYHFAYLHMLPTDLAFGILDCWNGISSGLFDLLGYMLQTNILRLRY